MRKLSSTEIFDALKSMTAELTSVRKEAADYMGEISDMKPEELAGGEAGGGPDEATETPEEETQEHAPGGEEEGGEEGLGEGKEKEPKIKTKEDAKRVLDKAVKDLQDVVDNLDGICGAAETEMKEAKFERFNEKYASKLTSISEKADKAIGDAKDSMKHWAFLKKAYQPSRSITDPNLKHALQTVKQVGAFTKAINKLFGNKDVVATAVPPTGAEFSGDKWPSGKGDPKLVEERTWHSGAEKFNRDKKWEDGEPNSAIDPRLKTDHGEGYKRDESEFVNASLVFSDKNPYESYWDIVDTKTGKRVVANYLNTPDELGEKNDETFKLFSSKEYGRRIVENVIKKEMEKEAKLAGSTPRSSIDGIDFVKNTLNGKYAKLTNEARAPKIKDKASVRKYYSDMYGDPEFARELTSNKKKADKEEGGMREDYKPKDDNVETKNSGEDTGEAKDGPGKISQKKEDPELIKARARRAVDVARYYAATGAIPFDQESIYAKAEELMSLSDSDFTSREAVLKELPIRNEAALKQSHIPEAQDGIVGNTALGVREPKAQATDTEDMNSTVNSDAKIAKKSSVVPQLTSETEGGLKIAHQFTTIESKLTRKGVSIQNARLRRPVYKGS
jgi:hypothetical protein